MTHLTTRRTGARRRWVATSRAAQAARLASAAIVAIGCLLSGGAAASQARSIALRLPGLVEEPIVRKHPPTVRGTATVSVPSGWQALPSGNGDRRGRLQLELAPGCRANIEVDDAMTQTRESMPAAIQQAIAFWFYPSLPPVPPPVPLAAKRYSTNRDWAIGTPPAGASTTVAGRPQRRAFSPYYGVLAQRVAQPDIWATILVGVRVPLACEADTSGQPQLLAGIEQMLSTSTFSALIG